MGEPEFDERLARLEGQYAALQHECQRLRDVQQIRNLMGRYQYTHTAKLHEKTAELFARRTPGTRTELVGWGVYEGAESVQRLYRDVHNYIEKERADPRGTMFQHTLTTPVVEVAEDGQTAKGVWISPGHETHRMSGKLRAYWLWVYYGVDFVKEDGDWKIWHNHVYLIFQSPYETSWVDASEFPDPEVEDDERLKPDRPNTYHWQWSPDAQTEYVPAPPEPYRTFDESMSYVPAP